MLVCFHILSAMAFPIMPDCLGNNTHVGTGYCLVPSQQLEGILFTHLASWQSSAQQWPRVEADPHLATKLLSLPTAQPVQGITDL